MCPAAGFAVGQFLLPTEEVSSAQTLCLQEPAWSGLVKLFLPFEMEMQNYALPQTMECDGVAEMHEISKGILLRGVAC